MKYRAEIDGLRALAVIPVILYHAGFKLFSGGYVGVDVFFVISGYLITTIILAELEAGTFSLIHFYERRARRILPALFLVMFVCLPFAWFWLLPDAMKQFSQSLVAVSTFASNILFWRTSGYFDTATELKPLIHTWSLAVEEQYYVLFPLFLLFTWKLSKRWIVGLLVFIFVISLAGAQWLSSTHPSFNFYMLPTRGWELLIGAFIAFYYARNNIKKHNHNIEQLGSVIGLLLIVYAVFAYDNQTPFPSIYALVPTVGAALIIIFASHKTVVGRLLGSKLFVAIGLISYSAYLLHQPFFALARERSLNEPSMYLMSALAVLSFAFAYLSWKYIERPFRNKHRISRNEVFAYGALCSAFFIGIGLIGHFNKGHINRFDGALRNVMATNDNGRLMPCDEEVEKDKGPICTIGSNNVLPSIALIGDSHTARLTSSLNEELAKNNISAIVYSGSWCSPLLGMGTSNVAKRPKCRLYISNAYSEILSNNNIKTVILSAEWANYTKGMRWGDDTTSFYNDIESKTQSLSENSAVFQRSLNRTKEILQKAHKRVIFVKSVPEYEFIIWKKIAKSLLYKNSLDIPNDLKIDFLKYSQRNIEVDHAFNLSRIYDWANVVEPYKTLCIKQYCEYADDDLNIFYFDTNHLTYSGSKSIVGSILRLIHQ